MKNPAICLLLALCSMSAAHAGDPVIGKQKAAYCIDCHGDHGSPAKADVPKIDRMSRESFVRAMQEMREAHHDLPITAHALSDQDVEDIASYITYGQ